MTDIANRPSSAQAMQATSQILGVLPKIAGLVLGLTAVAYYIGWAVSRSYYDELGASWVLELLTASQIMHRGMAPIALTLTIFFLSIFMQVKGVGTKLTYMKWGLFFGLLGFLCWFASDRPFDWISIQVANHLLALSGLFLCFFAGLLLGEMALSLALSPRDTTDYGDLADITHLLILITIFWTPQIFGSASARLATATDSVEFPTVAISSAIAMQWRLVGAVGDELLLVSNAEFPDSRQFRLVEPINLVSIETMKTETKTKGPSSFTSRIK
jgi:hypothetical protein